MRKIHFLSMVLLVVMALPLMVSCSSDNDSGLSVKADQLYGRWIVTSQVVTDGDGTEPLSYKEGLYIIFNEDDTGSVSNYQLFEDEIRGDFFTWSVSGDKLKITDSYDDDTSYFTVTAISSTNLQLTDKEEEFKEVTNFSKSN